MKVETHADVRGYFFDLLRDASERRSFELEGATEAYLVELLAHGTKSQTSTQNEALVYELAEALDTENKVEKYRRFRNLGDKALRRVGWFSERLNRRGVSRRYVIQVGVRAYRSASNLARAGIPARDLESYEVFRELSDRFADFAGLLDDIRESTVLRTPQDIVRLYDRWRRTGSPVLAERLRAEGVFPQKPGSDNNGAPWIH